MLNLFTLLIFLFVFVLVYVLRAFSRKRLRREALEDKLRQFKLRMEQESPSLAPGTGRTTPSSLASEAYSGPFPKLWRLCRDAARDVERLGWKKEPAHAGADRRRRLVHRGRAHRPHDALPGDYRGGGFDHPCFASSARWPTGNPWTSTLRNWPQSPARGHRLHRPGLPFRRPPPRARSPSLRKICEVRWCRNCSPWTTGFAWACRCAARCRNRHSACRCGNTVFFAVILIISQESGGRLADTLEGLAATLRSRAELAMKVQAKTSEARASIKIVATLVSRRFWRICTSTPRTTFISCSVIPPGSKCCCIRPSACSRASA